MKMSSGNSWHLCVLVLFGVSGADGITMSVMEGGSVTLPTNDTTNPQKIIKWYFGITRIAQIDSDFICTDVECNKGAERFKDRLKLDEHTGSLTIITINTTDTGLYYLEIISSGSHSDKTFNVTVNSVSAPKDEAKMKRNPVKEGESGLSTVAVAGICAATAVFVLLLIASVFCYHKHRQARRNVELQEQDPGRRTLISGL
ncbi:uncharacterized protein LOC127160683 isoform X2 [Labeo rohita]|uniref:uncharacterized protein LOC127160683 isoform X2 n=1 Tax=Labeo rohita TaxID=84645 RepID=UPI0021E1D415|nr:uncharacterized protein LOC127160683 isoform X2 [Labeo rohita]